MNYTLLDLYRYFASLLVCIAHFFYSTNSSSLSELLSIIGVELFFVLSGFVLTLQIKKVNEDPKKNLKIFFYRRWLRTIPPYIIALTFAALFFGYGNFFNFLKFITYTQNFFSDNSIPNFFPIAWSLSVEEWFYVLIPLLIVLSRYLKVKSHQRITFICILIITTLMAVKIYYCLNSINWGEEIRRSVILRLDSLCWGILAYQFKDKIVNFLNAIILVIFFVPLSIIFIDPNLLVKNIFFQILFFLSCSVSFSCILIFFSKFSFKNKIFINYSKYLANISYSMYLFHIFFITIFNNYSFLSFILYFISLTVFCSLFYVFFERVILNLRPKY